MALWQIILISLIFIFGIAYLILNREWKQLDQKARDSMDCSFALLEKGYVHYELEGNPLNPLVVLIHGFSTPSYTWAPTCQALHRAGFSTLRFDLYGRGSSDRPNLDYDIDLFVQQLKQLLDVLGIDQPYHLVGLSMGGPISATFANQHSDSLRSLTLIDPVVTNIFRTGIGPIKLPVVGEILMTFYLAPFNLRQSQSDDLHHPETFPEWQAQYKDQMCYKGFRRAILSTMRCMAKEDTLGQYQQLAQKGLPVLIIRGEQDRTISFEDIQLLRATLPHHRFEAIPDAGHIPHYEKPEMVNSVLVEFFSENNSY